MEGPGLSLFQGSDSIQLSTSQQRQEEDEEQEDLKRRNEEINHLLTNAFDDLDDDDEASSVNSSRHYNDVTRDSQLSRVNDSAFEPPPCSEGGPLTPSLIRREFGNFDRIEDSNFGRIEDANNYNDQSSSFRHTEGKQQGPTISDIQREYGVYTQSNVSYDQPAMTYVQPTTPYGQPMMIWSGSNSLYEQPTTPLTSKGHDDTDQATKTPYELPKTGYGRGGRSDSNEGYTYTDGYPKNYDTPLNHYEGRAKIFVNNGYAEDVEQNGPVKTGIEFGGGGDNDVAGDHFKHCYQTSPNGPLIDEDTAYKTAEYNSKEQLEVLYSVRMREIQRLTEEVEKIQEERCKEKSQLSRKLALAQAEVERSNLSRNQAQNLLVDAKVEIADLQTQLSTLKENVAVLEKTKQNMSQELSVAKDSVTDLQQKISVLERVQLLQTTDKTHEKFLKQAQEKHAVEMKNMQTQIDVLTDKLSAKESSCVALEHKLADVRRAHETLMVEKGDTMNHLSQALEESQAQCRHLMASNTGQEVVRLQSQLKTAAKEKEELNRTIQDLQRKLEIAKSDVTQFDSLLATTLEDESDSMRNLQHGEHKNAQSKPCDDMTNKLRGELQRCLAGQAVKRKEINRLENTLSQKEKEAERAATLARTCQEEANKYAKRVTELEQELKSLLTDKAAKANAEIQKLSSHLNETKKLCESLREDKSKLQRKLEETLAINEETLKHLHQESVAQQQTKAVGEYNKEYLEIHEKAVERVRREAQIEIVQLTVQLEQTQKELDRVKELYIDVCGTKEQLIAEHQEELEKLKETYNDLETRKAETERMANDLKTQSTVIERLTKECENYRSKIVQLEKDLEQEKHRREEHTKRIHVEIERAKQEALKELRNANSNGSVDINLGDHCSEHLDKIAQLEEDCKRLEDKLLIVFEDRKKMSDLQSEVDEARLRVAQLEISQESLKKNYEQATSERAAYQTKISDLEAELFQLRKRPGSTSETTLEFESMRKKYDEAVSARKNCEEKISKLEAELSRGENSVRNSGDERNGQDRANKIEQLEKELLRYEETNRAVKSHDCDAEERAKHLENQLQRSEEKMARLKELDDLKEERDQLVAKLKNQAELFERYVTSQKQVSVELNASPGNSSEEADMQRTKEIIVREVREEMEQKVMDELRVIEEESRRKQREMEEKYKAALIELQSRCDERNKEVERTKEAVAAERLQLQASYAAKERAIEEMIEAKLEKMHNDLVARKMRIESLEAELKRREIDIQEERNIMAQVMSEWAAEINAIKIREAETGKEIEKLRKAEQELLARIKDFKENEVETARNVDMLKHKYLSAKKMAHNYKEHAENKEKFLLSECKRIEEGYKRAMNQVQQKVEVIVSTQEEQVASKLKELESQYEEQLEQMRLKMKYKNKC